MREFKIPSHNRRYEKKAASKMVWMVLIFVGIICLTMYFLDGLQSIETPEKSLEATYAPEPKAGVVYSKPNFSLSYVEEYELPEWVSYELSVEMMNAPKNDRDQDFNPDPAIRSGSGHYRDYKGSGYRRGHLVPSADMAWNKESMDATFLLSNVAPMHEEFNDGIWLELEHNVRDWSRKYGSVSVVTGPLFLDASATIGDNEILVPKYFYKAVFTKHDSTPMVIAFLFDQHQHSFGPLEDYIVSVDSLEKISGIDLFEGLYGSWENEINSEKRNVISASEWPFKER
ncbi:MAG: DNA/RNA non-specific endonuclease [Saprospiraceae bacterium]|nr:DNA/RNA non-specific endonuclease [Saprospiraceae bacterium]